MTNKQDTDRELQKRRIQEQNENKINQLINTVENYTRTERHLEQHSDIGDPERLERAEEVQSERKSEIDHLKNNIVYGNESLNNNLENLRENYDDTQEYISHYGSQMSDEDLKNLKEKQQNRLEELDRQK
ncbi:hypothetical protein Ccar_15090 [Clostridium carboxidivorans P7]|uniref:Uncharacterized protein n=1 Tax=Clostridium carboxidivorans P7 TaxID=536227 RepID=C6PX73_9CLOT|nr:hypothetical protein [Clostridium carboxidivorans]AKN32117.1 hypothetical protein Ccar_15090 [Clostridium carboxidivorans P7]EET86129.1 conserved hypothetical protein [Clostridium carboxidivorans P7]EFG88945.1 hypothetical protein CLCAR_1289 [Clostridium carboxidivorans P7]